jgi:hypothetical protein
LAIVQEGQVFILPAIVSAFIAGKKYQIVRIERSGFSFWTLFFFLWAFAS